jgi:hypothetical protein
MPFPIPGPGRPKGSRTKQQMQVAAILERLGADPIEAMALIMMQRCLCPTCNGALMGRYTVGQSGMQRDPDKGVEMTCRTCWGTGHEPISPELRGKMAAELAQYIAPKRQAVDLSGEAAVHRLRWASCRDDFAPSLSPSGATAAWWPSRSLGDQRCC